MPTKTNGGQLRPLSKRLTGKKALRRAARIEVRKRLGVQYAQLLGVAKMQATVLNRGFFGRLKFALFKR